MKFLSLFTGVGGFDLGLERAGMTCIGQAERDPHCLKVLNYHYPNVPKFKDVRDVTRNTVPTVDLVCGGFPCQDVSVAGNRAGLAGERSGLWFEFLRILHELKPSWVVIENVPGLLSSNAGRDFATILHGLGECGYQSAWRVLDSQYWGVAQRRRRVFIVGCLGSGRAAEVLFERDGGYWNTPARRETGEGTTTHVIKGAAIGRKPTAGPQYGEISEDACYTLNTTEVHAVSTYREQAHGVYQDDTKASPVKARDSKSATDLIAYRTAGYDQYAGAELASTVTVHEAKEFGDLIAVAPRADTVWRRDVLIDPSFVTPERIRKYGDRAIYANRSNPKPGDPVFTLSPQQQGVITAFQGDIDRIREYYGVRRLTPLECERLQSFPSGWTDVCGMSDAQRYKQMGNAVTVNVIEWLGRRIAAAE